MWFYGSIVKCLVQCGAIFKKMSVYKKMKYKSCVPICDTLYNYNVFGCYDYAVKSNGGLTL